MPTSPKFPRPGRGLAVDSNIEFVLATKDPAGKKTTGITRTATKVDSFGVHDEVKSSKAGGADPWPTDRYLNFWACNLGEGLLGYAQFPGGPTKTDGVVILFRAFGTTGAVKAPFDKGRTATHEVGHFLGLRHIWGDMNDCTGNDFVADTPRARASNFGKPKFPHITCNNGPNGDMFMNYMDYVDDAAMVMFTAGQVARMNATPGGTAEEAGGPLRSSRGDQARRRGARGTLGPLARGGQRGRDGVPAREPPGAAVAGTGLLRSQSRRQLHGAGARTGRRAGRVERALVARA